MAEPQFKPPMCYAAILESIYRANGTWVEASSEDVSGKDRKTKQGSLNRAARERDIKIQTSTDENGRLFARLKVFPK